MSDESDPKDSASRRASSPLNNFNHREGTPPSVSSPEDLITDPTPAQTERIIYLVDDALDTIENTMNFGRDELRLKAAQDILDRSGLSKQRKQNEGAGITISADALSSIMQGLTGMFGVKAPTGRDVTNVTPPAQVEERTHEPVEEPSELSQSGLPDSLLSKYGEKE